MIVNSIGILLEPDELKAPIEGIAFLAAALLEPEAWWPFLPSSEPLYPVEPIWAA